MQSPAESRLQIESFLEDLFILCGDSAFTDEQLAELMSQCLRLDMLARLEQKDPEPILTEFINRKLDEYVSIPVIS